MRLQIQDDGCGFDPQTIATGHLGLNIMNERAQEIGASLQIQTRPGHGTTVSIAWQEQNVEVEKNG